jgi:hypothetical protein
VVHQAGGADPTHRSPALGPGLEEDAWRLYRFPDASDLPPFSHASEPSNREGIERDGLRIGRGPRTSAHAPGFRGVWVQDPYYTLPQWTLGPGFDTPLDVWLVEVRGLAFRFDRWGFVVLQEDVPPNRLTLLRPFPDDSPTTRVLDAAA